MRRRPLIPWIVLTALLLLTAVAAWTVADGARDRDRERMTNAVQSTRDRIEARLEMYIALLQGGAGLFAASNTVTHPEFRAYAERLEIQQHYPGIQGIGFSRHILAGELDSLKAAMQAQGFPDFDVWPATPGEERHSIIYLEPLDKRNQAAIGYDMFSEPTRRDAMSRAWQTGRPAMSGRVTLVQEIDERKQAGFLIYTPVYRTGAIPATAAARRTALLGFVYAPFRADDLFSGIFAAEERPRVAFRIYDGPQPEPGNLLHDSRTNGIAPADVPLFTETTTMQVGGHTWTITFATTSFFAEGSRSAFARFIAGAGLLVSLLLFVLSRAQQRAAEEARGSEARLSAILASLPVGVFVADRHGQITFSNAASREIWAGADHVGVERYDTYKGWWPETDHQLESYEWAMARALLGEAVAGEVVDIEAFDGTRKTVLSSAFPVRDAKGKVEMAVAALVDITEQRHAEAALREREREFRTMVDAIPQLAWMAGASGDIFWYNQRWYDYTGTTLADVAGWNWQRVHHPDHVERVVDRFRRALANGTHWEDTFPLRGKDGQYRWFLSRAVPIRDEAGHVVRWFGTNTDITEELQAREAEKRAIREQAAREAAELREAQLQLHAAELERSNRELQDFAYVASHDLQEPLRKISSFVDLLRTEAGLALDEQSTYYLDRIEHAAQRMSRLIKDLLAFSHVRTQTRPFEPLALGPIVADVLGDLDARLLETEGQVEVGPLPEIEADPLQMHQLFLNLIGNALKFHRPGVPPLVRVQGAVETAAHPAGTQRVCRIEVADNGIGFDEKYLDRIFSPFQRLHVRAEYEGTGIGLAICRRIAERHGGTITAQSTPGEGSRFTVVLPIVQAEEEVSSAGFSEAGR